MSFKTTVNGLFNDMQCYLVIAFVIIGVFQQTVGRVIYCILKKGNMWQKSFFFQIMLNEVLKIVEKLYLLM